jgi:signal transduction histidine kinase
LWLFKSALSSFSAIELRLVQQVANQCAIALRQALLYEAAQAQVKELQRLNQLKDDFLSTISHELRTPIANIKLVVQLLTRLTNRGQTWLQNIADSAEQDGKVEKYLDVLQDECERELHLIEDLLNLQHIEAGVYALQPTIIQLQDWIPHIVEPFQIRAQRQQQQLCLNLAPDLPPFTTDLPSLSRIITELLSNACKYTPPNETITIEVFLQTGHLHLRVINTGVEIAPEELSRIFDKFYRVPNNDPWKHSGTGLGLALAKKLVQQLKGTIAVTSTNHLTCFTVTLP